MAEEKSVQHVVVKFGHPVTDDDLAKLREVDDVIEVVRSGILGSHHGVLDYTLRFDE